MNVACTQCGTTSPPGNRFCGLCGSPLPPSPGNLPASARPTAAPSPPPTSPTPWASTNLSPCWQCGNAVDPIHQASCPTCGAILGMATAGPGVGPPTAAAASQPFGSPSFGAPPTALVSPPPPFTQPQPVGSTAAGARRRRSEPLVSGVVLTIIVAIVIILLLAIVGIVAGQAIGR